MSATDVQLRFAAEFALFLVSLAGVGFSFLRSDLLVVRPAARLVGALGFAALAAAALCSGALIVDDPSTAGVVGLRAAGIALLVLASLSWRPDSGGRELLRIGLLALVFAEVMLARDDMSNLVDVGRFIGAIAIGACLVGASSRVISARIAASGAMILFAVITVVAVALSTVISDNIEDEALRRYTARAMSEASVVSEEGVDLRGSAKVISATLGSTTEDDTQAALRRLAGTRSASDQQLEIDRALLISQIEQIVGFVVEDPRRGPTALIMSDSGRVAYALGRDPVALENPQTFINELTGVVDSAVREKKQQVGVDVVDGVPVAFSAYPISFDGAIEGVVVRTSLLDASYLRLRQAPIEDEQPDVGLALATRDQVLAASGEAIGDRLALPLATAGMDATGDDTRSTNGRFIVSVPVLDQDGRPLMALILSVPQAQEDATREDLYRVLFLVAMGAATAALVLAGVAGERIGGGLRRLSEAAGAIQAGNLDVRTGVDTDDELGALGTAFDSMARSLQDRTAELRQAVGDEAALRARLEAVVGGMGEALVAVDADGVITDFNAAAEKLFDVRARESRGRRVHEVVRLRGEDGRDLSRRLVRPTTAAWSQAGSVLLADGTEVPVVVSAGTLRGPANDVNGAVFVIRDERRERELERMKTEFLANISHELRTPLTPIKGFASILQTRDLAPAKAKGFADEISVAADQMERVIGQLVNFATVVGGRVTLDPEPIAVRPFVDDAVKRWRQRVGPTHKLVRRVPGGVPRLVGDRAYLGQCLDELIDNAVKYSPDGGQIVVAAAVVDGSDGPAMELSVSDEGVGIAADRLSSILDDFTQGDASATRRFGGLGLGLALVQRIARAHGGAVEVESGPSAGSRVAIVLPLDGPDGEAVR